MALESDYTQVQILGLPLTSSVTQDKFLISSLDSASLSVKWRKTLDLTVWVMKIK
jgi:hypothetical protein